MNSTIGFVLRRRSLRRGLGVVLFLTGLSALGVAPVGEAIGGIVPVAVTGDASPVAGATYSGFDTPVVSDDGRIVFGATLSGASITSNSNQALFINSGSGSSVVAREGSASPMGGQPYSGSFGDPMLRGGTLIFRNTPTGTTTAGLFGGTNVGAPALIGQSTNSSIKGRVDAQGDVAFGAVVNGGIGRQYFVAPKNGSVLSPATALAVADSNPSRVGEVWLNDHGGVAFDEFFSSSSQGAFISAVNTPGVRTTAATVTQSAPWAGAGAVYNSIGAGGYNNNGDVAYVGGFSIPGSGSDGLFIRTADGTHTMLAKQGSLSPAGGTFGSFFHPNIGPMVLTDGGNVVFAARTGAWDGVGSDTAIYSMGVNGGRTIARENDPVPGLGGTFVYSDLYVAGEGLGVDRAGRVLFTANLDDTSTAGLDGVGLMLYDPSTDKVSLLLRTGTAFDVRGDGSVVSNITQIGISIPSSADPSNHDVPGAMYGDQITFRLDFFNGMSGIYQVPEPGGMGALALLAALWVRRRN